MKNTFHRASFVMAGAMLLILQGCGTSTVSKDISDKGVPGEVVFPRIDEDAWLREGTFPNLDDLRAVAPGMTKDQLFASFGRPHFREGMGNVREWDYVFNFRTGNGSTYVTCQYKAIFDKEGKAQTFHWLPAACADQLRRPVPAPAPLPVVVAPAQARTPQTITLGADGLFRFDGGRIGDLLPEGRRRIEALAADLQVPGRRVSRIQVTGHTDRLGRPAYNEALSLARANTVREPLVRNGVASHVIHAAGVGSRKPVVDCATTRPRDALVACLGPNRRVEIEVVAEQP